MKAFADNVEIPAEVAELYNQWHEEHRRTGHIPVLAAYGRNKKGEELTFPWSPPPRTCWSGWPSTTTPRGSAS
jgi:hypothetical protein